MGSLSSRLVELRDWLVGAGVTQVAMEATGVYWKPVWHVLEDAGFELLLVNPAHFKNLPGRKTDVADSEWLAQLLECGLLRGSFIPPADIAKLRDLTRYRTKLIQERVRETQRIQKLLEDAGIKLDRWPPTCWGCRVGGCSRRSSPVNAIPRCSPTWRSRGCGPNAVCCAKPWSAGSTNITPCCCGCTWTMSITSSPSKPAWVARSTT